MSQRRKTRRPRADFAAALSRMYAAEVPAERHGAIRVGNTRERADVADLFAHDPYELYEEAAS